nr:thioesterase [Prevotella sp. oral taxon 472]
MSSGMLFHIIWNIVPSYLEQHYILAVTRRFTLKHNERGGELSSRT